MRSINRAIAVDRSVDSPEIAVALSKIRARSRIRVVARRARRVVSRRASFGVEPRRRGVPRVEAKIRAVLTRTPEIFGSRRVTTRRGGVETREISIRAGVAFF